MAMSFDPFSQLDRIAQSVFDTSRQPRIMPVDLFREGDRYLLHADLPGIDPGSVDVDVDGHLLTHLDWSYSVERSGDGWLIRAYSLVSDSNIEGVAQA